MPNTQVDIKKVPVKQEAVPGLWRSFRSEIDRLFDRFDDGFGIPAMRQLIDLEPFWSREKFFGAALPAVDVSEDDKAYVITAELPGLEEKDIEVTISGEQLVLKGEKTQHKEEKDKNHYLSERSYGAFERSFRLPDSVDGDKIGASFGKGVLTITLPKSPEAQVKPKKIEVKAA